MLLLRAGMLQKTRLESPLDSLVVVNPPFRDFRSNETKKQTTRSFPLSFTISLNIGLLLTFSLSSAVLRRAEIFLQIASHRRRSTFICTRYDFV